MIGLGILIGIAISVLAYGLFTVLMRRATLPGEPNMETLLQRATLLLHQIRVMTAANIVAFVVLGTLSIIAFTRLGDTNTDFTNLNRAALCDIYVNQLDLTPPNGLHCERG